MNVDQERWNLRVHTTHLADRIHIEAKLKLLRFALRLPFKELVTQLRLRIEQLRFEVALQRRKLFLPNRVVCRCFFVGQVLQLIVMRFDSVERFVDWVSRQSFVPALIKELIGAL